MPQQPGMVRTLRMSPIVSELISKLETAKSPIFFWLHYMDPHVPYNFHDGTSEFLSYEARPGKVLPVAMS